MDIQAIAQRAAARKAAAVANLKNDRHAANARADELYQARKDHTRVAAHRTQERELMRGHPMDLFLTPPDVAARMVDFCDDFFYRPGLWVEPSAGTGRIAQAIRNIGIEPHCYELNYNCVQLLKEQGFAVTHWNFLEIPPADSEPVTREGRVFLPLEANVIIMNPPFRQDLKHVRHAYACLAPGGRIVAIISAGPKQHAFCDELGIFPDHLPAGTFKTSGTNVPALLVVIDK